MREQLLDSKRELEHASDVDRPAIRERHKRLLNQFSRLVVDDQLPDDPV
jgi:hypothetical protein